MSMAYFCPMIKKPLLLEHWVAWLYRSLHLRTYCHHHHHHYHHHLDYCHHHLHPDKLVLLLEPSNARV